jgi:hypothetical protein
MYPTAFLETGSTESYKIYSCKFSFGLPSTHAVENMALLVYILIDYVKSC